jgi:hypothetical protein
MMGITYSGTYKDYVNCDVTIPVWTYAFVAVKNPALGPSQSFVSVTDKEGQPCMPLCLAKDDMTYEMCTGVVNATTAQPRIYANTLENESVRPDWNSDVTVDVIFICSTVCDAH